MAINVQFVDIIKRKLENTKSIKRKSDTPSNRRLTKLKDALSYKAQKISEQIPSGNKPHILIFGHWHTSHYFFYRNMHILNAGCFEDQSLFLLRKGINPVIGGWTIKVRVANDKHKTVLSITPTFIPFMKGEKKR